jgi:membrane protein YdbS with pleckstrin-like domain
MWRGERFNAGEIGLKNASAILPPSRVSAGGDHVASPRLHRRISQRTACITRSTLARSGLFDHRNMPDSSRPSPPTARRAARGRARPCVEAGVERYTTYRLGGMRDRPSATMAATSKCLARSDKSGGRAETTNGGYKGSRNWSPGLGYVETILEPGEQISRRAHLHWIVYVRAVVLLLIGVVLMLYSENVIAAAGFVAFLFGIEEFVKAAINRRTTEIAVTNQRIISKCGLIRRDTIEINMQKVESVDVQQSILGRLLNYGTVIVRGTGGGINPLAYVSEPLPLRRAVMLAQKTSSAPS